MADDNNASPTHIGPTFNDHASGDPAPVGQDARAIPEYSSPESSIDENTDVSSTFYHHAPGIPDDNIEQGRDPLQQTRDSDKGLTATAKAEIALNQRAERAFAWQDDKWRQISDRLSHRPQSVPVLDMDGGTSRSVTREYNQHRQEWTAQHNSIEANAAAMRADIRAQGTTLTREYADASGNDAPSDNHDAANEVQHSFAVKAADHSRGR